ncbi:MAG: YlmC/YmxH family sporulation protein [Ruminococcus sp.]
MNCRLVELRHKEVINSKNGCRIGYVDDLEIDTCSAMIRSIVIFGGFKFLGLFGRRNDCVIPWKNIELIGQDTILVNTTYSNEKKHNRKMQFFKKF